MAVVPDGLGGDRGEVSTGACRRDADAVGHRLEIGGVPGHVTHRGLGVLDGGRVGVFRREPVVHRQDGDAGVPGETTADVVRLVEAAEHPAATMEVNEKRARRPG